MALWRRRARQLRDPVADGRLLPGQVRVHRDGAADAVRHLDAPAHAGARAMVGLRGGRRDRLVAALALPDTLTNSAYWLGERRRGSATWPSWPRSAPCCWPGCCARRPARVRGGRPRRPGLHVRRTGGRQLSRGHVAAVPGRRHGGLQSGTAGGQADRRPRPHRAGAQGHGLRAARPDHRGRGRVRARRQAGGRRDPGQPEHRGPRARHLRSAGRPPGPGRLSTRVPGAAADRLGDDLMCAGRPARSPRRAQQHRLRRARGTRLRLRPCGPKRKQDQP